MSQNRIILSTVALLTITAVFSTASISAKYETAGAVQFVGSYFSSNSSMITFHADGTTSTVLANMFSLDINNGRDGRRMTPGQGVWQKSGKKIKITSIFFLTDLEGNEFHPEGVTVKVTSMAVFDKPVNGLSPGYQIEVSTAEVFTADQNPVTDTPIQIIELEGGVQGYRLQTN